MGAIYNAVFGLLSRAGFSIPGVPCVVRERAKVDLDGITSLIGVAAC